MSRRGCLKVWQTNNLNSRKEDKRLEEMAFVKIDAEEFSIIERPSSATTLVAKQRDHVLGSINLPVLVEDLVRVGNFVRIAYNGVVGSTELQIQIREIGYDVTKLCNWSATTVSKFKHALQGHFGWAARDLSVSARWDGEHCTGDPR